MQNKNIYKQAQIQLQKTQTKESELGITRGRTIDITALDYCYQRVLTGTAPTNPTPSR